MAALITKLITQADAQVKATGAEGVFEGWASKYGNVDSYGDTIIPGAFAKALASGRPVAMYYNHVSRRNDMSARIGTWEFSEKPEGLWAKGTVLMPHPLVKNIWPSIEAGLLDGLSIGFYIPEGGAKVVDGIRQLHEIDLRETSIVDDPADQYARVSLDSIKGLYTERDFENLLRDAGFSNSEAKAAVAAAKGIFAKPVEQATKTEDETQAVVSALKTIYGV